MSSEGHSWVAKDTSQRDRGRVYICRFSEVNASKEKGGQGLQLSEGWNTQEVLWQRRAFPGSHFKGHGLGLMLIFGQVSGGWIRPSPTGAKNNTASLWCGGLNEMISPGPGT